MRDIEEHWWRMIDYSRLMGNNDITLNRASFSTFQFSQRDIEFGGFSIRSDQVKPLANYLYAIKFSLHQKLLPTSEHGSDLSIKSRTTAD